MKKKSNIGWWIAGLAGALLLKKKAAAVEGIGGRAYTLTEDERYSLRDLFGYFVGSLGCDGYEEEIAELQEYKKMIPNEEFKILENIEDFLDDDYNYPRFKRSMLDKEERKAAKNFLQWVEDNGLDEKLFPGSQYWDFIGGSEKMREL